jgi:iron complex outermembrane receptor protein
MLKLKKLILNNLNLNKLVHIPIHTQIIQFMKNQSNLLLLLFLLLFQSLNAQTKRDTIPIKNDSILAKNPTIGSPDFSNGNRYDPWQLIQGKVPGAVITRPGGDPNYPFEVQIRGLHSAIYPGFSSFLTANGYNDQINLTQPLVIVDGIPGVSIQTIDPQDIEKIEIIRDAASLSNFGMRGANGAIQITTKKAQLHTSSISYSSYVAFDQAVKPDLGISAATFRDLTGPNGKYPSPNRDLGASTDWYKAITRNGFSHAHNLVMNGSTKKTTYRLSVNLREVNGIAQKSSFDQINTLFNFNKILGKNRGKLGGLFALTNRNNREINPDIFRNAAIINPTAPIRSDTAISSGGYYNPAVFGLFNPVAELNQQTFENNSQIITAGLFGEWQFFKGLKGILTTGYQHNNDATGWVQTPGVFNSSYDLSGAATWNERRLSHWYFNAALDSKINLGANTNHQLETELGYSQHHWNGRGTSREGLYFDGDPPTYQPLASGGWLYKGWQIDETTYREIDYMPAFYAKANYTFHHRWFAKGSLRQEKITRLSDNKWALYPSFTLGGNLIRTSKLLSELNIQLSYGETGNIPPKSQINQTLIMPGAPFYYNGQLTAAVPVPTLPNANIGSEVQREWNLGIYYHLKNNRVSGQFQFYRSRSSQLLWQSIILQTSAPTIFFLENNMALVNRGVEVQLNATAVQTQNFTWISQLNFARNKTILDAPVPGYNTLTVSNLGGIGFCCGGLQLLENKKPIGQFYTYSSNGVSNGTIQINDVNKDGQLDETGDKTITGNAQPKLTFGWNNNLNWKRFSLNVFWRGALGHKQYNIFNLYYASPKNLSISQPPYSIPAMALTKPYSTLTEQVYLVSNYFLQNSSFVRLENLNLSYDVPFLTKNKNRQLQFYIGVQNLLTICSFKGNDPEVRLSNVGARLAPGVVNYNLGGFQQNLNYVDRGRYPITQSWFFGVRFQSK